METKGIMPRRNKPGRYPTSRDFTLEISCDRKNCFLNIPSYDGNVCVSPSGIKIGSNGKCKQYKDENFFEKGK